MNRLTIAIAALAGLAVVASPALAGTIYVVRGAVPPYDGSPAHPYAWIQDGIVAALSGDTVIVAVGTYPEHTSFLGKNITVRSTDPTSSAVVNATIIDGTNTGAPVTFDDGEGTAATLSGFTICNGRSTATGSSHGGGIDIQNASPTITNNVITNCYTTTDGGGIAVVGDSAPRIEANAISDNTAEGWGGGIFVYGDTSDPLNIHPATPEIVRNRVTGNYAEWDGGGVACFEACTVTLTSNVVDNNTSGQVGGGVFVGYGVTATVENCTLADNDALGSNVDDNGTPLARVGRGGGVAAWFGGAGVVYDSCILWGGTAKNSEGDQASLEGTSAVTVRYSDAQGGQAAVFKEPAATLTWGTLNQNTNPLFSPTPGDYHLQSVIGRFDPATGLWVQDAATSPCVDAGNPSLAFSLEPAPNGNTVNAGGYGNTPEASKSGVPFVVELATDWDWVYQNTPVTTQDRHKIELSITIVGDPNGNSSYGITVAKAGGTGDVTVQATAEPLEYDLLGGRIGSGGLGSCTIQVSVVGNVGGAGSASTVVTVRQLGDIEGDGDLDANDKAQMNKRLNSLSVSYPERAFNLTGDLDPFGDPAVDANDKAVINRLLNSLEVL